MARCKLRLRRRHNLLSALDRLINRGASAVVGFALTFVIAPHDAGIYAAAYLVLSVLQALGEIALRQTGPIIAASSGGPRFLRAAGRLCAVVGGVIMSATVCALAAPQPTLLITALQLAPLVGVAAVWGFTLPRLVWAQISGQWHVVASSQWKASLLSLVTAGPLVPLLGLGAGTLQTLVAESLFFLLLPKAAWNVDRDPASTRPAFKRYITTAESNAFGWLQSQAERLALTVFGSLSALGIYAIATQLARAVPDAVYSGSVAVLRTDLASAGRVDEKRLLYLASLRRLSKLGLGLQCGISLAAVPLTFVLPERWISSLYIMPILAAACVPLAAQWSSSTFLIDAGRGHSLRPAQVVGVILAAATGLVLAHSLLIGAMISVAKDLLGAILRVGLVRSDLSGSDRTLLAAYNAGSMALGATMCLGVSLASQLK